MQSRKTFRFRALATPDEKDQLDRLDEEIGRLVWGEEWPEVRERARRLNGGRG